MNLKLLGHGANELTNSSTLLFIPTSSFFLVSHSAFGAHIEVLTKSGSRSAGSFRDDTSNKIFLYTQNSNSKPLRVKHSKTTIMTIVSEFDSFYFISIHIWIMLLLAWSTLAMVEQIFKFGLNRLVNISTLKCTSKYLNWQLNISTHSSCISWTLDTNINLLIKFIYILKLWHILTKTLMSYVHNDMFFNIYIYIRQSWFQNN